MVKLLGLKTKDSEMSVDMYLETASMAFFSITYIRVKVQIVVLPLCIVSSNFSIGVYSTLLFMFFLLATTSPFCVWISLLSKKVGNFFSSLCFVYGFISIKLFVIWGFFIVDSWGFNDLLQFFLQFTLHLKLENGVKTLDDAVIHHFPLFYWRYYLMIFCRFPTVYLAVETWKWGQNP